MAVRDIRKIGDPVLRDISKEVDDINKSIITLANDMIDTITKGEDPGVGLAAPQIGISKKVIVINYEDEVSVFINPIVEVIDNETVEDEEGCLSVYSIRSSVKRPKKVKLKAMDLNGKNIEVEAEGMLARIFQHEVDHLNGILFIDHLDPEDRKEIFTKINEIKGF